MNKKEVEEMARKLRNENAKKWREKNKEKVKEIQKNYWLRKAEKVLAGKSERKGNK